MEKGMTSILRKITKMSLVVLLLIFITSLFFSLIIIASISENLDQEKNKIKEVLTSKLATDYINKPKSLISDIASSNSFTSFLSNNIFLNIKNSTASDLGQFEFQIGMRSHKGFKNCRGFNIQLKHKGKIVTPHQYSSRSIESHLNLKHNSVLEKYFLKNMQVHDHKFTDAVLHNISPNKINSHLKLYVSLAKNPNTPEHILHKLATVKNKNILRALARNVSVKAKTLKLVSSEITNPYYLTQIANHKKANQEIFNILSRKSNIKIDLVLAKNKNTPQVVISKLFERYKYRNKSKHKRIVRALLSNKNTSSKILAKIFLFNDRHYLESIARHRNTPPKLLTTLVQHKILRIKLIALLNPNTPLTTLEHQLAILDPQIYYALAMNPAANEKLLLSLMQKAKRLDNKMVSAPGSNFQPDIDKRFRSLVRLRRYYSKYFSRSPTISFYHLDPIKSISPHYRQLRLSPSETLFTLIAIHPNASKAVLTYLHQRTLFALDNLLSQHINTSDSILKILYKRQQWNKYFYAPDIERSISSASEQAQQKRLFEARRKLILSNLAKRQNLDADLANSVHNELVQVVKNDHKAIREVSLLPLSERHLKQLLAIKFTHKTYPNILERNLARNPDTPENILLQLAQSKLPATLDELARRDKLSQQVQKQLLVSTTALYESLRLQRKNIYSITRVFTRLAANKLTNTDTLTKISQLNIRHANSSLLNNPKLSTRLRQKLLTTLLFRKQCNYTIAYNPNDLKFDNIVVKTKVSNADDFLVIFDIATRHTQQRQQFAIRDDSSLQTLTTRNTITTRNVNSKIQNNVRIDTRQKVYSVFSNYSPTLVVQRNKVSYLYSTLLKPVTWISGKLITNREFKIGKQNIRLDQASFINYFISRNSYIPALYFAFTLIALILIAAIYTLSKLRQQKVLLSYEANKLEENIRRKAYIAELLGHEIKSPLHSLQQSLINDDKSQALVQRINQAISKFSDLEAEISGLDGEIIDFNLNQFLIDYCRYAKEYKGIDNIQFKSEPYEIMLRASAEDLEIVLDHIMNNANDFREHGTSIIISAKITTKLICLSIANQGPSIPDNILDSIFEFGKSSRNETDSENLGQGLYIAREKLKELNATIQVKNTDNGVIFTIIFAE